jgi:hypothetical protein
MLYRIFRCSVIVRKTSYLAKVFFSNFAIKAIALKTLLNGSMSDIAICTKPLTRRTLPRVRESGSW